MQQLHCIKGWSQSPPFLSPFSVTASTAVRCFQFRPTFPSALCGALPSNTSGYSSKMAETDVPPVVTEPVGEAAPALDGVAAAMDPAPSSTPEAAGTKRKFDEAAGGPEGAEDEHVNKRVVLEPEVGATTSAEVQVLCALS